MSFKMKKYDILLCSLFMALFRIRYLPEEPQIFFKLLVITSVLITILRRKIDKCINISLLYCACVCISCFINYRGGTISFSNFLNGVLYALCIYCIYTLIGIYCDKYSFKNLIDCLYSIVTVYAVISFVSILVIEHEDNVNYFFGPTFLTCYLFLLWFGLYIVKKEKIKVKSILFPFLVLSGTFVYLQCSTMVVVAILVAILLFLPEKIKNVFASKIVLLFVMLVAGMIVFIIEYILQIPTIQYIIVNILRENLTLTDRLKVYIRLENLIEAKKWFGYGYQNDAVYKTTQWASNAQNGLINLIINYGVLGGASFVGLCYHSFNKAKISNKIWGLYVVCYGMILASIVEISYNYIFLIIICLIRWSGARRAE